MFWSACQSLAAHFQRHTLNGAKSRELVRRCSRAVPCSLRCLFARGSSIASSIVSFACPQQSNNQSKSSQAGHTHMVVEGANGAVWASLIFFSVKHKAENLTARQNRL